jgi:hypothetical protein
MAAAGILAGVMILISSGARPDDPAPSGLAARIGVVYRGEVDDLRLAIAHPSVRPGSRVAIVTVPDGRLLCCWMVGIAYVLRPEGLDPVHLDKGDKATYALDAAGIDAEVDLGFGIVDVAAAIVPGGGQLDLDGDGVSEGFRSCASAEGLHLTVWSDGPLAGLRLWHAYVYLGYDVEPDCEAKEYE